MAQELLLIEGVNKEFPGVKALSNMHLNLNAGEVLALVGENGAGKSTLMKILSGIYQKDSGTILIDGQEANYHTTGEALQRGITIIAQELSLVPARSVMENVYLGIEDRIGPFVSKRKLRERYLELEKTSGIKVNPDAIVSSLRNGDKQKVEILRALARNSNTIVMDEPTARLSVDETENLKLIIIFINN